MKKYVNTMVASAIVLFPGGFVSAIATAAPPGFTPPAQGLHLNVQPPINSHQLNAHPVIPRPAGHVQLLIPPTYTYTAITKSKASRQDAEQEISGLCHQSYPSHFGAHKYECKRSGVPPLVFRVKKDEGGLGIRGQVLFRG